MDQRATIWAMLYANLCGMALHPGNLANENTPDLDTLAAMTDELMQRFDKRFTCQSGQQP